MHTWRCSSHSSPPRLPGSWQGHEFNLVRAVLRSADFAGIQVTGGRFLLSLTRYPGGRTSFDGMHVSGGEVDLSDVDTGHYTAPPVFDQWQTPPPGLLLPDTSDAA
jgi:hypothetical protein